MSDHRIDHVPAPDGGYTTVGSKDHEYTPVPWAEPAPPAHEYSRVGAQDYVPLSAHLGGAGQADASAAGNAAAVSERRSPTERQQGKEVGPHDDPLVNPLMKYKGEQNVGNKAWAEFPGEQVTRFLTPEESAATAAKVGPDGRLLRSDGQTPLDTSKSGADGGFRSAGQEVFVMNEDRTLKVANDQDEGRGGLGRWSQPHPERFHHTSFEQGAAVIGAGGIQTDARGQLVKVTDQSGHYRPEATATHNVMSRLQEQGVRMVDDAADGSGHATNRETRVELMGKEGTSAALPDVRAPRELGYDGYSSEQAPSAEAPRQLLASQFMQTGGNERQIRLKDLAMFELRQRANQKAAAQQT